MNEGMDMAPAIEKAVEVIKDPVVVKPKAVRTNRVLMTYRNPQDRTAKPLKLYIRDGVVMNPKTDEAIIKGIQESTLTVVRLRRTGEPLRVLEHTATES